MDRERSERVGSRHLAVCQAIISSSIVVDLRSLKNPPYATARWWPAWGRSAGAAIAAWRGARPFDAKEIKPEARIAQIHQSLSYNGKPAAISPARSITHLGWQQESALARTRSNTCSRLDSSSA